MNLRSVRGWWWEENARMNLEAKMAYVHVCADVDKIAVRAPHREMHEPCGTNGKGDGDPRNLRQSTVAVEGSRGVVCTVCHTSIQGSPSRRRPQPQPHEY